MKCFYHKGDLDGWCSAAIIKYKLPQCKLIGLDYGEPFPWEKIKRNEPIYMVDFAIQPLEEMEKLNQIAYLTWIDHHKTSLEFLRERNLTIAIKNRIDLKKAACEITWEEFIPDKPIPIGVQLLGRYDVWDLDCSPDILPFQYAMRTYAPDPGNCNDLEFDSCWRRIFENDWNYIDKLIEHGKIILKYKEAADREYCKAFCFETKIEDIPALAINKGRGNSQLFESMWNPDTHPIVITFVRLKDYWTISLYTVESSGIDVSKIARKYGGGGHKCAAGFQAKDISFKDGNMHVKPLK